MSTDPRWPKGYALPTAEDWLLSVLSRSPLPLAEARAALASADEASLSSAVLRKALLLRPAVRDVLLDRDHYQPETLARIASVFAQLRAASHSAVPSPDFVARMVDRHPSFSEHARDALLSQLADVDGSNSVVLNKLIESALFCPDLSEDDLLVLVSRSAEHPEDEVMCLIAFHPHATPTVWSRLLDLSQYLAPNGQARLAAAIASRPAARRDPTLRERLESGPHEARLELAVDADRPQFVRIFTELAQLRPDLAVALLMRVDPPRSEWIPLDALVRLLENADSNIRQTTIAALGRLRITPPLSRPSRSSTNP